MLLCYFVKNWNPCLGLSSSISACAFMFGTAFANYCLESETELQGQGVWSLGGGGVKCSSIESSDGRGFWMWNDIITLAIFFFTALR